MINHTRFRWMAVGVALGVLLTDQICDAQWSPSMIVVGNGAIRVHMDRVEFDWPRVRACALSGDTVCRVALAARESR